MKLNIANPTTGAQKLIDLEDDKKCQLLYDKRIAQEVDGEALGDQFKGYTFKITGGMDKDGFAMKQGVLVPGRVRLLLSKDTGMYRPKRSGCRVRRSVRGCIVAADISVLNVVVTKQGPVVLPGLDTIVPRRLGPKRANNIRKLFNLDKKDDVRKYVVRRKLPEKEGKKPRSKAPKIQRLITPRMLQHKRQRLAQQKKHSQNTKTELQAYKALLASRQEAKRNALSKKKSVRKSEVSVKKPAAATTEKKVAPATTDKKPTVAATAEKKVEKKTEKKTEKKVEKKVEKKTEKPAAAASTTAAAATTDSKAAKAKPAKTEQKPAAAKDQKKGKPAAK